MGCSFIGPNYLCISSSPSLEVWLGPVVCPSLPPTLPLPEQQPAHLPPQPPESTEQLPRADLCFGPAVPAPQSLGRCLSPFPATLALAPISPLAFLRTKPSPFRTPSCTRGSVQPCCCLNLPQVAYMRYLSWAPSMPLEPCWGGLGVFSIQTDGPRGRKRKRKTLPELLS